MMIRKDQPTIFGKTVVAGVSSLQDGNMKFGMGLDGEVVENRRRFLKVVGIDPAHTTLVNITYDSDDFAKYRTLSHHDKAAGMLPSSEVEYADALVVDKNDHALFLPLADCVGAILYDDTHKVLMASHLGRHSAEVDGARRSVEYLVDAFGVDPRELQVWLSPAVGKASYPLTKFGGKGLHEIIVDQLHDVGVMQHNVEVSVTDTATAPDYFSHSEYLKDNSNPNGRFAIVAMMRVQGEPAA